MHRFGIGKEPRKKNYGKLALLAGAAGGLAGGLLFARRVDREQLGEWGSELRHRLESAAARLRPARLRRAIGERRDLADLEDAVLDIFLNDGVLSRRGIDVGAISHGIIELSGSVMTEEEARHAVEVARQIPGVETVVNRLDLESELRQAAEARGRDRDAAAPNGTGGQWHGRNVGMGRMRQSPDTEPDRPDDSQKLRSRALEDADTAEELTNSGSSPAADRPAGRTGFEHDDLDNQDPFLADHNEQTLAEQPEARNPDPRVGEGPKPGTELDLEQSDVPMDQPRREE